MRSRHPPRPIESLTYNEQTLQKMEIAYNEPRPTLSLRYNEQRPKQMEVAYNEPRSTQSLTYNEQRPQQMEIAPNEPRPTHYPIEYIQQQTISHTPQQAISHVPQQMEIAYNELRPTQSLTYNEQRPQKVDFTQQRHIPITQENMQIHDMENYKTQPFNQTVSTSEIEKNNPNIGKLPEMTIFLYSLSNTYLL